MSDNSYTRNLKYPLIFGSIFMGMRQKKGFLLGKKIQNGRLKKTEFFKSINSQYLFTKISGIGPWHWCGSYVAIELSMEKMTSNSSGDWVWTCVRRATWALYFSYDKNFISDPLFISLVLCDLKISLQSSLQSSEYLILCLPIWKLITNHVSQEWLIFLL